MFTWGGAAGSSERDHKGAHGGGAVSVLAQGGVGGVVPVLLRVSSVLSHGLSADPALAGRYLLGTSCVQSTVGKEKHEPQL